MPINDARLRSLRLVPPPDDPQSPLTGISIDLAAKPNERDISQGVETVETIEHGDGSATFDFNPQVSAYDLLQGGHFENLALKLDEAELGRISSELMEGIQRDNQSRQEWLETRARGITLLGLKLEEPRGDLGTSSAPLEGMSTVRHPLLLEAVLRFQATARGELLPASGPVKVRNDATSKPEAPAPTPPMPPPMAGPPPGVPGAPPAGGTGGPLSLPTGGPPPMQAPAMSGLPMSSPMGGGTTPPAAPGPAPAPMGGQPPPPMPGMPAGIPIPPMPPMMRMLLESGSMTQTTEDLADALEKDFNHYLTSCAPEYYPDTDRMLFWVGAGGQGIKKVFNCPLRRRPVSESVDAEDLIVSNATTDLENCGRITHRIKMRPSVLKRMQIIGAYRDVEISKSGPAQTQNVVDKAKANVQGITVQPQRPEEMDEEIYESYCELNIKGFEHKSRAGKVSGLQCPYKVVVHVQSRQILEIRRNWEEGDELCMPRQFFVDFPFVRALGFYAIGLIHIIGNTTTALTAAWREMLDAGMFANFPGFIYNKAAGRQLTNQFRVPPGGGVPLDAGAGKLSEQIMPLPYKDPSAAFIAFIQNIQELGAKAAGAAEITIGEGTQDIPVGTTMAVIEQATKVMDAVHKRLHTAQAIEFKLLKKRFKDDPEAFWRHNKRPTIPWRKEQFLAALENNDLVPVADPNNPTSLHRIAKATAIKQLQQANPAIYDPVAVDKRIMRTVGIDPEGLFKQTPDQPEPDPRTLAVIQKTQAQQQQTAIRGAELQLKAKTMMTQWENDRLERESRERVEEMKILGERMRLQQGELMHEREFMRDSLRAQHDMEMKEREHFRDIAKEHAEAMAKVRDGQMEQAVDLLRTEGEHRQSTAQSEREHQQKMQQSREQHQQKLESARELGQAKVETARAMARAKPKTKGK